ncbi:DNA polymerase III subunit beta [Marinactinospora endophytica]
MKLTVNATRFAAEIGRLARLLPARPTVPVLAGIRIAARDEEAVASVFDYETSGTTVLPADVAEPGVTVLPGRTLAEAISRLDDGDLTLTGDGARISLRCGPAKFTLPTLPVEDYPTLPAMPEQIGTVPAGDLAAAVAHTHAAAATDITLPTLTGIRLAFAAGGITLTATDRYRAAQHTIGWAPTLEAVEGDLLVPAAALAHAVKTLDGDQVTLHRDDAILGLSAGGRTMTTRLIDAAAPPIAKLLDAALAGADCIVDTDRLRQAVLRVAAVAERGLPVHLHVTPGRIAVTVAGATDGEDVLDAAWEGEQVDIAFAPRYLADALTHVGAPQTRITLRDGRQPALLRPAGDDHRRHLIMPIRVDTATRAA